MLAVRPMSHTLMLVLVSENSNINKVGVHCACTAVHLYCNWKDKLHSNYVTFILTESTVSTYLATQLWGWGQEVGALGLIDTIT